MKKILALVLFVFACSTLSAQTNENKKSAFQFSFVPPLGTNGTYAPQYTNTVSLNLLVGISQNEEAFALGGLSNVILNNAKGAQIAGLSNHIGNDGKGLQTAGVANINKNRFSGLQFAGLINTASEMKGAQLSGLINIAKDVKGAQFAGLINIAGKVNGAQFAGLVNIADESDCPIGLINIIKHGEMGVAVTYDGTGNTVVSFRSGGRYTYGILGVGYNHKTKNDAQVAEIGLGAHIPVASWFRINNELKVLTVGNDSDGQVLNGSYSLLPSFKIGQHFELSGGASINYMTTKDVTNQQIFPNHSLWEKSSPGRLQQLYVGYQFGIQYIF